MVTFSSHCYSYLFRPIGEHQHVLTCVHLESFMHVFNLVFRGPCKCFIRIANVVTSMKACMKLLHMKLLLLRHYNSQRKQSLNIVLIFLLSLREVQRLKLAFTFACFKCFELF